VRRRAIHHDANGHVGADDLTQSRAQTLCIALLEPGAGEIVLYANHEHPVVGQLDRRGVLEPCLEARRVEFSPHDG